VSVLTVVHWQRFRPAGRALLLASSASGVVYVAIPFVVLFVAR
jgi:hypothetical protein